MYDVIKNYFTLFRSMIYMSRHKAVKQCSQKIRMEKINIKKTTLTFMGNIE